MSGYRIAFDIGGTFTDLVLIDEGSGEIRLHKLLTTPSDPAEASLRGIDELSRTAEIAPSDLDLAVHGTTLVTNAIIERKGARVGLITTKGFRDAIEIGREQRYDIDDLFITFPDPLVPRRRRLEIAERISRDGDVLRPASSEELAEAVRQLVDAGVESLVVCFLHSYRNDAHEREALSAIRRAAPDLPVSLSADVAPEIREYERVVTTAANAYVQPLIERYLGHLEAELASRGFPGRLYLMQSNGGTASVEAAKRLPITLLESGPAGGAMYAAHVGSLIGTSDLLAFDMGGTTAKACLIQNGRPDIAPELEAGRVHRFKRGSGLPIKAPVIDMIEIGAGGGSIARVNALGLLQVGPDSAGADPGPACYGRGGIDATVTDANLVLGYLDPDYFLGGRMRLDEAASQDAIRRLGQRLDLDPTRAAAGVHRVVNENMAAAARIHIVEKGRDPRNFSLVAFGGAAPAHACSVARLLGAPEVIIPQAAGAASALGFLVSPLAFDLVRSLPGDLATLEVVAMTEVLDSLESEGRERLEEAGHRGDVHVERFADMRILGQVHEIQVALPDGHPDAQWAQGVADAFRLEYVRLFEHVPPVSGLEVLNWRVRVTGHQPPVTIGNASYPTQEARAKESRPAFFQDAGGYMTIPVFDRYSLPPGFTTDGPAIIEEREATTIVLPGDSMSVDDLLQLRIRIGGGDHA